MNKLKVVTLFSGIGAQESALDKLGINYEIVGYSEIDKFAIQSYTALYGEQPALGDITQIKELPECDLCTYSFPCTDISIAGNCVGLIDIKGNKTRSGLLLDVERLLYVSKEKGKLPKMLLMENVKNLVGNKFKPDFDRWLSALEELGYNNYWKVLNAKDYGVPQNRERVFVISILKEYDKNGYVFPEPFKLETRLVDILESNVPESYYLSDRIIEKIKNSNFISEVKRINNDEYSRTLRARDYKDPLCINAFDFRVRKLTEREYWRLMGFTDEQIDKVKAVGMSKSQMYKQAGNSIVVNVLYYIFKNLQLKQFTKEQ